MRRRDKLKNIDRANMLAEQRYLKSKSLLSEAGVDADGWANKVDPLTGLAERMLAGVKALGDVGGPTYYQEKALSIRDDHEVINTAVLIYIEGEVLKIAINMKIVDPSIAGKIWDGYKSASEIVKNNEGGEFKPKVSKNGVMSQAYSRLDGAYTIDVTYVPEQGDQQQGDQQQGDQQKSERPARPPAPPARPQQEGDETIVENAIPLNQWVNPQRRLSAGGYLVFTEYNGEYFRGTARMVHGNIDSVKDVASIPQERYETYLQMYNQRHSDLR